MNMQNTNGKVEDYYQCTDKRDAPRMEDDYVVKVQCPRNLSKHEENIATTKQEMRAQT